MGQKEMSGYPDKPANKGIYIIMRTRVLTGCIRGKMSVSRQPPILF